MSFLSKTRTFEPSPQSEFLSVLEQVFMNDLSVLCSLSILTSLPVPAAEKHPHRDGSRYPPDVTLGIQAKEFNLGFIRPENRVSHGMRVFRCLLANSK